MRWRAAVLAPFIAAACSFFPPRAVPEGADVIASAPKPAPVATTFEGCDPDGAAPDSALNLRKNRIDEGHYREVPWQTVAMLPWPPGVDYRFRSTWSDRDREAVARYEGAAVTVEGYAAAGELKGREPTNCYSADVALRDYHLWLAASPDAGKDRSIITEITPRLRARRPGLALARLDSLVAVHARVRVSGWLLLDSMHPESIGHVRVTLWEVHPVMRLEAATDSGWVEVGGVDSSG